jgi:uncharacterized protein YcfJ
MTRFSRLSAAIVGSVLGMVISHQLAAWAGIPLSWTTSGAVAWGWTAASAWHCITKGR